MQGNIFNPEAINKMALCHVETVSDTGLCFRFSSSICLLSGESSSDSGLCSTLAGTLNPNRIAKALVHTSPTSAIKLKQKLTRPFKMTL